jgi:hypothetical protein
LRSESAGCSQRSLPASRDPSRVGSQSSSDLTKLCDPTRGRNPSYVECGRLVAALLDIDLSMPRVAHRQVDEKKSGDESPALHIRVLCSLATSPHRAIFDCPKEKKLALRTDARRVPRSGKRALRAARRLGSQSKIDSNESP